MSKKFGLCLGSGGSRGVTHIGVLAALEEAGIKPDYISGCSMGSVIGACYASGMRPDEMLNVVLKLKTMDLIDINTLPFNKLGFVRGDKIQNLLTENIGDVTFDQLKIPFCCVAVDMYSGKLIKFDEGPVAIAVQASSCIPLAFKPVNYKDMLLIDGGVLCRLPTRQVKDMGADVVIAIDALTNAKEPVEKVPNMVSAILRVFDIMDYNYSMMKLKLEHDTCDLLISPEMKGINQYKVKDIDRAYTEGYEATMAKMDVIKDLLK